jgi:hypothetical protein
MKSNHQILSHGEDVQIFIEKKQVSDIACEWRLSGSTPLFQPLDVTRTLVPSLPVQLQAALVGQVP